MNKILTTASFALSLIVLLFAAHVFAADVKGIENLRSAFSASKAIDLTHRLREGMSVWPGAVSFSMEKLIDYDQGYLLHKFEMGDNAGTHVDAPAHFAEGKLHTHEIALKNLIAPAVVIDVQKKVATNPDYTLTPKDIQEWESKHGKIPPHSLVILNTGWHKKFNTIEYVNMDDNKVMHFPGFHPDSAALLIERDVVGAGIDTLSLDFGGSTNFGFHVSMLNANRYQIENLANLDAMPITGAIVVVGVLPIEGSGQAQARVIALLP